MSDKAETEPKHRGVGPGDVDPPWNGAGSYLGWWLRGQWADIRSIKSLGLWGGIFLALLVLSLITKMVEGPLSAIQIAVILGLMLAWSFCAPIVWDALGRFFAWRRARRLRRREWR